MESMFLGLFLVILGDVSLQYYVDEIMKPQELHTLGNGELGHLQKNVVCCAPINPSLVAFIFGL